MLTGLTGRHYTIGHQILDLEAELGIDTKPYKETLDRLVEEARATIQVKDTYTREEAVGILSAINNVIRSNGLNPKDSDENHLFHEGIGAKSIYCDDTSFIYLSIAEALGLPLAAVLAPNHLFVRFMFDDGSYINWETIRAMVVSDDDYKQRYNIADAAIENGIFLKNLTRDEVIAGAYNNRGIAWAVRGKPERAVEDYSKAMRLDPKAFDRRG